MQVPMGNVLPGAAGASLVFLVRDDAAVFGVPASLKLTDVLAVLCGVSAHGICIGVTLRFLVIRSGWECFRLR